MTERKGNLALIEGPAIIVHGVNAGWQHGPKFDDATDDDAVTFAKSLAERGPMARESYFALEMGRASHRDRFRTMAQQAFWPERGVDGLPLGLAFPRRIEGGVWLVHGVTQRSVRGTKEPHGREKTMVPNNRPAVMHAIAQVLDATVAFVRDMAKRTGVALPLHMPRIGCGLGGLEWDDVRAMILRVEDRANVPLDAASDDYRAACEAWPVNFNVWSL